MAWLLRFSPDFSAGAEQPVPEDREVAIDMIMSRLWDLGTTGLYRSPGGEIVAGFESEAGARAAGRVLAASGSMMVEPAPETAHRGNDDAVIVEVDGHGHRFDLVIDANAAFGHGAHPTTRLALDLLLETPLRERRVLDVGTGTGVLAIAAAKAGAARVTAIDNDPTAAAVAADNGDRNGVVIDCGTRTIPALLADLDTGSGYDVVVCNVLLAAHRGIASELLAAVTPGGVVITSGYLADQADELVSLYTGDRSGSLAVERLGEEDGWSAHRFRAVETG